MLRMRINIGLLVFKIQSPSQTMTLTTNRWIRSWLDLKIEFEVKLKTFNLQKVALRLIILQSYLYYSNLKL